MVKSNVSILTYYYFMESQILKNTAKQSKT